MFEKIFKKLYKSRKTVTKEEASKLKNDIRVLEVEIDKRLSQIEKFETLIVDDPRYKKRYLERISAHKRFIKEHLDKIEEIEMILLDS